MTDKGKINPSPSMDSGTITLIMGGVRSGKSRFGEQLAHELGGDSVMFVATAEARDEEMQGRIQKHRQSRPASWLTLEQPLRIGDALNGVSSLPNVVLLDCLTLLVSNVLCSIELDSATSYKIPPKQFEILQCSVEKEIDEVLAIAKDRPIHLVIISGEVGLGLVPDNALGRAFRDLLGWANQKIASQATATYFMMAGLPIEINSIASNVHDAAIGLRARLMRTD